MWQAGARRTSRPFRKDPSVAKRILIAAGGTAGHVVPALAVADALRADGAEVAFVGGERAEAALVPQAGYALHPLGALRGLDRRNPLRAARAALRAVGRGVHRRRLPRPARLRRARLPGPARPRLARRLRPARLPRPRRLQAGAAGRRPRRRAVGRLGLRDRRARPPGAADPLSARG